MDDLNTTDALPDEDNFENDRRVHIHATFDADLVKKQFTEFLRDLGIPANKIRLGKSKHGPSNVHGSGGGSAYYEELPPNIAKSLEKYYGFTAMDDVYGNIRLRSTEPEEELYFTLRIPVRIEVEDYPF